MLVTIGTPYVDTTANALGFVLGGDALHPLAVRTVRLAGIEVELRLLGASHQVFAGAIRETVACLPDVTGPLPRTHGQAIEGWSYRFTAEVSRPAPREFSQQVKLLRERFADLPNALGGVFPGSPEAMTVLSADVLPAGDGSRVTWSTWHTYPQTAEIVMTQTVLEPA
ncbi:DUF2617 family protein [Flindersiella endophytica]